MTPKDELTGPVADVVAALGALGSAPAPEPGPALQALFSAAAVVTAPPAVTTPRRSPVSTPKRLLASVPSKIAAGVLGALLAGSLGAGAMTGTIQLTSNDEAVTTDAVTDPAPVVDDTNDAVVDDAPEADEVEAPEVDDPAEEDGAAKDAGDPTTAPVPTTVDEAAHNHQFDEACGNHGAYVSHFARTGEEPECATTARAGATSTDTATATDTATVSSGDDATATAPSGAAHGDAGKAKAAERKAAGKAKAKGGRSGR